jgi:hypothetical protein
MTKQKIAIFTLLVMTMLVSVTLAQRTGGDSSGGRLTVITGADGNVVRLRSTRFL